MMEKRKIGLLLLLLILALGIGAGSVEALPGLEVETETPEENLQSEYSFPENALVFLDINEEGQVVDSVGFTTSYLFDYKDAATEMNEYIVDKGLNHLFYRISGEQEDKWQAIFDREMEHEEIVDLITQKDSINYYDYQEEEVKEDEWSIGVSEYARAMVTGVNSKSREVDLIKDCGSAEKVEVPADMEVDFEWLLGREMLFNIDDNDVMINKEPGEYALWKDAVEVNVEEKELKLLSEDISLNLAGYIEEENKVFARFNGVKTEMKDLDGEYDYARVVVDSNNRLLLDIYNWIDGYMVVDGVDDDVLICRGGAELDIDDFVIKKQGETISGDNLEEGDMFFFNSKANNSLGEEGFAEVYNAKVNGAIQDVMDNGIEIKGAYYQYDKTRVAPGEALYIEEDSLNKFDREAAAEMKDVGDIELYLDRAGEMVFVKGGLEKQDFYEYPLILQENIEIHEYGNNGLIEITGRSFIDDIIYEEKAINELNIIKMDELKLQEGKPLPYDKTYPQDGYYMYSVFGDYIEHWEIDEDGLAVDSFEAGGAIREDYNEKEGYMHAIAGKDMEEISPDSTTIYAISEEDVSNEGVQYVLPLVSFDEDYDYQLGKSGIGPVAHEEEAVISVIYNFRDNKLLGFGFFNRGKSDLVEPLYPGSSFLTIEDGYRGISDDTMVFDIQHGEVSTDLQRYKWGELEGDDFDFIAEADVYLDYHDVCCLVVQETDEHVPELFDRTAVIDSVRFRWNGEIYRIYAWVEGEKQVIDVAADQLGEDEIEGADLGKGRESAGEVVILSLEEETGDVYEIKDIQEEDMEAIVNKEIDEDGVNVADRTVEVEGAEYKLIDDGYVYDVTEKGEKIEEKRLRDLDDGDTINIILEKQDTGYAELILKGEMERVNPFLP